MKITTKPISELPAQNVRFYYSHKHAQTLVLKLQLFRQISITFDTCGCEGRIPYVVARMRIRLVFMSSETKSF